MSDKNDYSRTDYNEELRTYGQLLGAAISVSETCGGIETETRYIRATQVFTRMVIIAYTFLRLLPGNPITHDRKEHWDWPSVAGIARNFLEAYLHFFYIGVEDVTQEEVDFRIKAMWFHLNSEKYRIYKSGPNPPDLSEFERNLPQEKVQLQQHPFFQRLNKEQRQRVVSANSPTYMTKSQLMARLPFPSKELLWMYRHYSNEVHSTAFAFNSQSNIRGRGDENFAERSYMIFACWLVRKYLSSAIMSMARIFPKEVGVGVSKAVGVAQAQFQKFTEDQ